MAEANPGLLAELRLPGRGTDAFITAVYNELRQLAQYYLRQERSGHTLQATALVHEVYLRLIPQQQATCEDRGKFVGIAAHLMRQILVDYARTRQRDKRGGKGQERVPLEEDLAAMPPTDTGRWEELDQALQRLEQLDPRQAQIVELRYFGGLTVDETAQVLHISPKTVKRDCSLARAWLRRELTGPMPSQPAFVGI
jgi:RNA polymerase sigma factor (TIGR02999 family)